MIIKTEVLPYHDDLRLLVVHVQSTNPRPVEFELQSDKHDAFGLRVRALPADAAFGKVLHEDAGDLIASIDLLKKAHGDYDFLSQAKMDDMEAVVVKAGSWVSVTAGMELHNGTLDAQGQPDADENSASTVVYISQ